jgi:hypothetical protein
MLNILLFKHCSKDEPNLKAVRDEQRYIVKNANDTIQIVEIHTASVCC